MTQPILPDDVLEDIFLRLDGAADLARLYAACTTFRRVVSGRRFLRRFRSVHPPPVLGFLDSFRRNCLEGAAGAFRPAQPPHRSAKGALALAPAADFTFAFLPDPGSWSVRDARDGRVLMSRGAAMKGCNTEVGIRFTAEELVACDPLHRRYVQIPSIPGDLATSAGYCGSEEFKPFFDPIREEEEESSIRVICIVQSKSKVGTFVYSSVTGNWRYATSFGIEAYEWLKLPKLMRRHYAHGCFYWADFYWKHMLVLDTEEMKFSVIDMPPEIKGDFKTIVEIREDMLGLVVIANRVLHIYVKSLQDDGVGDNDWWHNREIALPNFHFSLTSTVKGYILLRGILRNYSEFWNLFVNKPDAHYFTLNLKTFEIERLCMLEFDSLPDYLYAIFPPPLSPASI